MSKYYVLSRENRVIIIIDYVFAPHNVKKIIGCMKFQWQKREPPIKEDPPTKNFKPLYFLGSSIMEIVEDTKLNQLMPEFHLQCFVSQNLVAKPCVVPQNILIVHAALACLN